MVTGKKLEWEWMRTIHRMGSFHRASLLNGFSKGDFMLMDIIEKYMTVNQGCRGIYVSELARQLKISSPAVSRKLGILERKGFIRRDVDEKNRRNTYVFLTDEGRAARAETKKGLAIFFNGVVTEMGAENMEELLRLCNRLLDVMEANLDLLNEGKRT